MGEEMGYFTEIFKGVLQGIKSLAPADPNWPRQQIILINQYQNVVFSIYGGYSF